MPPCQKAWKSPELLQVKSQPNQKIRSDEWMARASYEWLVLSQSHREGFPVLKERQHIFPPLEPVSDPGL